MDHGDRLHAATARYQLAEALEDERFRTQLAPALYRVGRQAEALEVCRYTRRLLVDELGVEPGPALAELEQQAILHQDPELTVDSAEETIHGVRLGLRCVIEIDGVAKPACCAHPVVLLVRARERPTTPELSTS